MIQDCCGTPELTFRHLEIIKVFDMYFIYKKNHPLIMVENLSAQKNPGSSVTLEKRTSAEPARYLFQMPPGSLIGEPLVPLGQESDTTFD